MCVNYEKDIDVETLTQKIRNCKDGAAANPYQGADKKVLFVCSMGILRSATCARMYASKYNTRSVGSYSDALIPISPLLMQWADEIVFVNEENYENVKSEFDLDEIEHKIKVLDIPDKYPHMHLQLQAAIQEQYEAL